MPCEWKKDNWNVNFGKIFNVQVTNKRKRLKYVKILSYGGY